MMSADQVANLTTSVDPSTLNLNNYIAVPGKIIPIPGTDFALITPESAVTVSDLFREQESTSSPEPPPPPLSSQIRRRGRPFSKETQPCQCPNCQEMPGADRHLCHFVNCGKTFTKTCHLEAHLRNHMGAKPFQCPEPECGVKFVRADDLKRHSYKHSEGSRYRCGICGKKFNRKDHFNSHSNKCLQENSVA